MTDFNMLYGLPGPNQQTPQQFMAPQPVARPLPAGAPYAGFERTAYTPGEIPLADSLQTYGGTGAAPADGNASWSWFGGKNPDGSIINSGLGAGVGAAQALFNGYLGMQQLAVAKKTLAEGQRQFDMNYGSQRTLTNARLEDRQRARVASNSGAYESVGTYMNRNGVK